MFFLIDKPIGISSFDVIRSLRKTLQIRKMGHSGTLDPLASGCLLIATENSTKLLPLLEKSKKEYIFTVRLDGKSESLDYGTPIMPVDTSKICLKTKDEVRDFLLSQKRQLPPLYSALHIDGERAYDLARKWKNFTLPERPIEVFDVEILEMENVYISIRIILSSGGYVRSFAPVIGKFFGIDSGYVTFLQRTKIYTEYWVLDIQDASSIEDPIALGYETLFWSIASFNLSDSDYEDIRLGKNLDFSWKNSPIPDSLIFLKNKDQNYTSLCTIRDSIVTIVRNNV